MANDGQLLSVGLEGIILRKEIVPRTTPILIRWERVAAADGGVTNNFSFRGFPGQRFSLDRSVNLKTWEPGPDLELLDGSGVLEYSNTTRAEREFYRAKLRRSPAGHHVEHGDLHEHHRVGWHTRGEPAKLVVGQLRRYAKQPYATFLHQGQSLGGTRQHRCQI